LILAGKILSCNVVNGMS